VKLALLARQKRAEIDTAHLAGAEPIAVVGIGCRFPGGADAPERFWHLLREGTDTIREVPGERWPIEEFYDPDPSTPGKMSTRWGAFLDSVDAFDAAFFGITPREAARMDPQQRLFLEVAWEALESAGQTRERLSGSRTGVFAACYQTDYARLLEANRDVLDAHTGTGTAHSIVANRLSFLLNLTGPSITVDTACSASLVAAHLACQSLRAEECDLAVTGGVNLILAPEMTIALSKWGFMAPDGRCKTFDARADGFVRGEGCGVVVLKRLSDALADGDRVLAVIRGSAVNQDGRTNVLTAPSGLAQRDVLRRALDAGHVAAADVDYVEAHGTGTVLGDPIEVEALRDVYGVPRADGRRCLLGSVKTNIGHLEAAAGVAGLIKAVLCLQHGAIPPVVHFQRLNPHVSLDGSCLAIPTDLHPWPAGGRRRFAAVSSFGVGGTNAHLVLEEAPAIPDVDVEPAAMPVLLPLSAHSPRALRAQVGAYRDLLAAAHAAGSSQLAAICHTAAVRRTHHAHRLAVWAGSAADMASMLTAHLDGRVVGGLCTSGTPESAPSVVFVFSGQGPQWWAMGRELLRNGAAEFRTAVGQCDAAIRAHAGWSVLEALLAEETASRLHETQVAQPAIFTLQVALASLWRSWGIVPDALIGHSVGEVAAAHVAGALSLEDAARVVTHRGRIMQQATGKGRMAAVETQPDVVARVIAGHADVLAVAAVNAPRSVVLSGDPAALERVLQQLRESGVTHRMLPVDYAFHSPQMTPLQAELADALAGLTARRADLALISCVTGDRLHGDELGAAYWARGIRDPVRFSTAVDVALDRDPTGERAGVFLEIGPHPVLGTSVVACLAERGRRGEALPSLRRGRGDRATLLTSLAALYVRGATVSWHTVQATTARPVELPPYAWQRSRVWIPGASAPAVARARPASTGHLLHPIVQRRVASPLHVVFESLVSAGAPAFVGDHRVHGTVLFPATGFVEAALVAAEAAGGGSRLEQLEIQAPLVLGDANERRLQVIVTGRTVQVFSAPTSEAEATGAWTLHATAQIGVPGATTVPTVEGQADAEAVTVTVTAEAHYEALRARGLDFGPAFRGVTELARSRAGATASVTAPETLADLSAYRFHPALLDACLQPLAALLPDGGSELYLPIGCDAFALHGRPGARLRSCVRLRPSRRAGNELLVADVHIRDEDDGPIAEVHGLRLKRADAEVVRRLTSRLPEQCVYELAWEPAAAAPVGPGRGPWLLLADARGIGDGLAARLTERGERVTVVHPAADPALTMDELRRHLGTSGSVVHLWSIDARTDDTSTADDLTAAARGGCGSLLEVVQALASLGGGARPRLFVVTAGAQRVGTERGAPQPTQTAAWGLARVVETEHPELGCVRIDLDAEPAPSALDALADELLGSTGERRDVALRERRYAARLRPRAARAGASPIRLEISERGVLDRLTCRPAARRRPAAGEIEIEVALAGLNFRDVLNALGMYPGDAGPLGGECAGRVVAVGPDVTALSVGDRVVAVTLDGGFSSYVTVSAALAARVPDGLALEDAATIPIAFLTAHYALDRLAKLGPDERVLVHAAAGGVGMAAVQLAHRAGAEVYATAGSDDKRALLAQLGVRHVFSSRTLDFAPQVMERTQGRGVDVVLNSLAGEFIPTSLEVLARGGRFVEIGKTGIWDEARVANVRPDVWYRALYFGDVCRDDPALVGLMLAELLAAAAAGELTPLPRRVFPVATAADAFRHMAQARHVGKVVLAFPALAPAALRADATYLVTGGLGALGLEVARWLAERGARHLVLMGRRGASPEAEAALAALREAGVDIAVAAADVASERAVRHALGAALSARPPLRGVVHAAGALDDGVLLEQRWQRLAAVLAPKMLGAWTLDVVTRAAPLDFFVMFSSAAGVLGAPGQGSYAAANAFLDGFAHYRRAHGRTAVSIDWGPWAGTGMAATVSAHDRRRWREQGVEALAPAAALAVLGDVLVSDATHVAVLPGHGRSPATAAAVAAMPVASLADELTALPAARRRGALTAHVREQTARVLGVSAAELGLQDGLRDLGMDSLMAVELRNRLQASVGQALPATLAFDHPTIEAIAAFLASEVGVLGVEPTGAEPRDGADQHGRLVAEVGRMSDAEAEAELLRELDAIDRDADGGQP
jgi:acyl transferase domain-containing protein/aryl carrier-like protein